MSYGLGSAAHSIGGKMVLTALKEIRVDESKYLSDELTSNVKHEYINGVLFAMVGACSNHVTICLNLSVEICSFLKGKKCKGFDSDMKLKTSSGKFRYPDIMVVCDEPSKNDLYKECPIILVEVLSKSTRRKDKTEKKIEYLNIPTLEQYVLIEQDFIDVEVFRKENNWRSDHYFLGDRIPFSAIGDFTMSIEDIYEQVILKPL